MGPPIPHIEENYVSLGHVVGNIVQQSYADLQTILRTLPSIGADVARKRELLSYIVQTRQQLVKLYVLCKWAVVAPDISQCIDVANWLHGQTNCFNNVVATLFHLQQNMSAAKLQYADIESALQILKYGNPLQENYNFLVPKKLDAPAILETLQNLNVLLAIRLALVEKLSPIYRNYTIKDGRAKFVVGNSMQIDLGIADDSVDARFFFVDFNVGFNFELSPTVKVQLETMVNEKLTTVGLQGTLDWVLHFASNCKLSVIHQKLLKMQLNYWSKVLTHTFSAQKSLISIHYWLRPGTYELRIGINHAHLLQVQWFVSEEERAIPEEFLSALAENLDVEAFMNSLTRHHAKLLLDPLLKIQWIEKTSNLQLALNFSRTRSSFLAIDHSSGMVSLQSNGELMDRALDTLNSHDDLSGAPQVLEQLRLLVLQETIEHRARAIAWQGYASMRMDPLEQNKFGENSEIILGLRLQSWAEGWFVVVALGSEYTKWWATQMVCKQKRWRVETFHALSVHTSDPDYSVFARLAEVCTKQFTMYELCRELEAAKVDYKQGRAKMQLYIDIRTLNGEYAEWAHSGLIAHVSDLQVKLEIHIKGSQLDRLGKIDEDGINLNNQVLMVSLERETGVLPQVYAKLDEIDRVAKWLHLASKSNLQVRHASLKELQLNYTEDALSVLTIRGSDICLADDNPQKFLSPFLPPLLARGGLFSVINVLIVSYPVCEVVRKLNCIAIPHSVTMLRIQLSLEEDIPQLYVQLKTWRDRYMVYMTANEAASEYEGIKKIFTVPSIQGCVPLRVGVAAPIDKSESLLTHAVGIIKR